MRIEEALAVFGLDAQRDVVSLVRSPADIKIVRTNTIRECARRYRQMILKAHPDVGGDHAEASRLNEAMDLVRKLEIRIPQPPMMVFNFTFGGATSSSTANTASWGFYNA